MTVRDFVIFLLPIFVGAIIGLFTNWLAIKMLFRPLTEKRLWGVKIPFTPGILPRERKRIAESLGKTVALDLLNEESLMERLCAPDFVSGLEKALAQAFTALSAFDGSSLGQGLDSEIGKYIKTLAGQAGKTMVAQPVFRDAFEKSLAETIELLSRMPVASILKKGISDEIHNNADASGSEAAGILARSIMATLQKKADEDCRIGDLLDAAELAFMIESLGISLYPIASKALLELLGHNPLRSRIEKITAGLLKKALQRFNSFQRFFISLGQYDRAIMENVPATVDDFLFDLDKTLSAPEYRHAIIKALGGIIIKLGNKRLNEFSVFRDEADIRKAEKSLASVLASLFGGLAKKQKLGDVFALFPELMKKAPGMLTKWLESLVTGSSLKGRTVSRIAGQFTRELGEGFSAMTIGQIIGFGDAEAKRLAVLVAGPLAALAARESATILSSLDIRKMVEEKINSLDMIEVEKMLLRIIERELNAITWFGALLGGLIGLGQSLLALLQ